ncbi:hypothetical protein [Variovorax sp. PAMC 28711]|uniref:hypothetical protein n=1 Tax=Variovorax sp. PAMC 28711 TaxID=1795631 RepID=UPI00078CAF3C|nr:hypothetical protein [Variovorax sp. PAMC 28711]AMM23024.1 hypothetical protein AX767_00475 [Variovorax sp. PAMC 28711]
MKTAIVILSAFLAIPAISQTLGNTNGLRQDAAANAVISPGALTVNTLPNSPITAATLDNNIHTNQAMSAAPAFGVQGYGCAKPGSGATLQVAGVGGAVALAGDMDPGCEAPRDINTMAMVPGQFTDEDKARRACAVPAIAKASPAKCQRLLESARIAEGFTVAPTAARSPMPWQAGG